MRDLVSSTTHSSGEPCFLFFAGVAVAPLAAASASGDVAEESGGAAVSVDDPLKCGVSNPI